MSVVAFVWQRSFFFSWAATLTERRYNTPPQAVDFFSEK
jgi:hypothetical protein